MRLIKGRGRRDFRTYDRKISLVQKGAFAISEPAPGKNSKINQAMKNLIAALAASFALAGLVVNLQAADAAPAEKPAMERRTGVTPFRGTVSAVDKVAGTISIKNAEMIRVFHVVTDTKITKDGNPASVEDAAVGDYATGAYLTKVGKIELRSLKLGSASKKK
jgi:hypothetical protein